MSSDEPNKDLELRRSAGAATRLLKRTGADSVLVVRKALLTVSSGAQADETIEISNGPVLIGTDANCNLILDDVTVSARHAELEPGPLGYHLRDLGSTNGTFVDGYRIGAVFLPAKAALALGSTQLEFSTLEDEIEIPLSRRTRFGELLGHSEAMKQVFAVLEKVAKTDVTLLLEGESGTGKDVAARSLHRASPRGAAPFVAVDCGSIPANLIESELFGHRKGAFTGATGDRIGLFEQAGEGTLFLDEVGELPPELQPKLLRALESHTIRRVGDNQERPFGARLVAATNRNLRHEVKEGRFREDLYFRLSVISLRMPPLRERREEIPRLVAHFLQQHGVQGDSDIPQELLTILQGHTWPGNVRELRNAVERLAVLPGMKPEFYLDSHKLSAQATSASYTNTELPFHEAKRQVVEQFERAYLGALLKRCQGNISELARVSQLSRQSCHRLLNQHGIAT